ncbi:MAG: hypothetical protein PGN27_04275 [Mycolicibacterium neoaurum]|uniref:hypothetical protein n=1 Tax=Mycolicibacterium neoaurum TaxID=1795 RepID=UPI002FF65581
MTDPVTTSPVDEQRASALLSHLASADQQGAAFIVNQSAADGRHTALLAAIADTGGKLMAALRTDTGIEAAVSMVQAWVEQDESPDHRRAGGIIACRFQFEHAHFLGHIADAAAAGRLDELVLTTAQCYLALMPELHAPKGRATLAQMAAALSSESPDR